MHIFIVSNFIFAITALLLHSSLQNVLVFWFVIVIKLHSFSLTLQERISKRHLLLKITWTLIVEGRMLLLILRILNRKLLLNWELLLLWKLLLRRKIRLIKIRIVKLVYVCFLHVQLSKVRLLILKNKIGIILLLKFVLVPLLLHLLLIGHRLLLKLNLLTMRLLLIRIHLI